jgi:tRNA-splicing ligase RtcB
MCALKTDLKASDLPDGLQAVRTAIEKAVPHGRTNDGGANDRGGWQDIPGHVANNWALLADEFREIVYKHPKIEKSNNIKHLGTLGTGNHFIELCLDEHQNVWIMLHSGSRGVGGRIGSYFIQLAKEDMRKWHINLPDMDLAYMPEGTQYFRDYIQAVDWAQNYARINREIMMEHTVAAIEKILRKTIVGSLAAINCHHNYVAKEKHFGKYVWVTRKGAIRARNGDLGIIPGSMGARSFIVKGLGNRDSLTSCSHGAGRVMSRTEAKKVITLKQHREALEGVECRNDGTTLDESPAAYKDIDAVMAAQSDLIEVVATLKQVLCVKG